MNWTFNTYFASTAQAQRERRKDWNSRIFATRREARRFAKREQIPQTSIINTLKCVNSAIDDWGQFYFVAPDGSYYT